MSLARGRHLDAARTQEIYAAATEVLAEVGYERLTMDAVATHARASKATLYRHWPSKAQLVTEAVRAARGPSAERSPDTGTLRQDLLAFFGAVLSDASHTQVCLMRGLVSACSTDPELAAAVRERLVDTKRAALVELLARARSRGEIADGKDLGFLVDVLPASLMYRFIVTNQPVDAEFIERLVDEVALPLLSPLPTPTLTPSPTPDRVARHPEGAS